MNTDIELAAFHEAGHSVIYHMLGNKIKYIEIDEMGNGYCAIKWDCKPSYYTNLSIEECEDEMLNWGMKCLSGWVAECKVSKKSIDIEMIYNNYSQVDDFDENMDEGDFNSLFIEMDKLNNILKKECFGLDFVKLALRKTQKVIDEPKVWNAIETLSLALHQAKDKFLLGRNVHELIIDVLGK